MITMTSMLESATERYSQSCALSLYNDRADPFTTEIHQFRILPEQGGQTVCHTPKSWDISTRGCRNLHLTCDSYTDMK